MKTGDESGLDWTVVLRRQPVRIIEGEPQGGYTDLYELICCDCGDHPDLDYREVAPELQAIRGPYPIAVGVAAYEEHVRGHPAGSAIPRPRRADADEHRSPAGPSGRGRGTLVAIGNRGLSHGNVRADDAHLRGRRRNHLISKLGACDKGWPPSAGPEEGQPR